MKFKKYFVLVILFLLINSTSLSAQQRDDPVSFDLGEQGHELTVFAESSLVWQENENTLVTINFTMSQFPSDNQSTIEIRYIQFFAFEQGSPQPELIGSNTSLGISLNVNNNSEVLDIFLPPPSAADRFYLNITIGAFPVGGGAVQEVRNYSFRFPTGQTIIVERDNLVPLINLYGFPPGSYFSIWLPIYLMVLFLFGVPGIIFGVRKLVEVTSSSEDSEDGTPTISENGSDEEESDMIPKTDNDTEDISDE